MVAGHILLKAEPHWQFYINMSMENVDVLETLSVVMSNDGIADINIQKIIDRPKCRQAYLSLDNIGMPYPGLPIDIKMYLYKTVCLPTLRFGMEIMILSDKLLNELESFEGSLTKRLSKFSHHSKRLDAPSTQNVSVAINNMTISLWKWFFKCRFSNARFLDVFPVEICVEWRMYPKYTNG